MKYISLKNSHIILISIFFCSPEWRPENAIWIGASDTKQEGRFAWTDKSPMDYKSKQQFVIITRERLQRATGKWHIAKIVSIFVITLKSVLQHNIKELA